MKIYHNATLICKSGDLDIKYSEYIDWVGSRFPNPFHFCKAELWESGSGRERERESLLLFIWHVMTGCCPGTAHRHLFINQLDTSQDWRVNYNKERVVPVFQSILCPVQGVAIRNDVQYCIKMHNISQMAPPNELMRVSDTPAVTLCVAGHSSEV